jgi:hypothetical protein
MGRNQMLVAYEDRGVIQIKDAPTEETRVPLHPIETHADAVRRRAGAMLQRPKVRWEIVGKGPYGVHGK